MKRYVLLFVLAAASHVRAATPVAEAPIRTYGTPATVAISSTTQTMVPTSQMSGRVGFYISAPSANASDIVGFIGNCTSTAIASTVRPKKYMAGTNDKFEPLREDQCLWLIALSTLTATSSIHYQEVGQ